MELTERKKKILRAVVESFVQNAEPVGSKAIAQSTDLDVSSATIRNEMAELTSMGYLEQPHTSAGRIPSAKGYRLYVNELMDDYKLSMQETERINSALNMKMQALDRVIDEAGKVVAKLTQYPAFALTAAPEKVTIQRYDLLLVEENTRAGGFSSAVLELLADNDLLLDKTVRRAALPDAFVPHGSCEQLRALTGLDQDHLYALITAMLDA